MSLGGLVLAGGSGSRLGGGPKATVVLRGRMLVVRAVDDLRAVGCDDVLVVIRPGIRLPPLPARLVVDDPGPPSALRALASGLDAIDTVAVAVLACDLPLARPLLARLVAAPAGRARVAVDDGGRAQPLCARYPRVAALTAARRCLAADDHRVVHWAASLDPVYEPARGDELLNVNDPDDLTKARMSLSRGHR